MSNVQDISRWLSPSCISTAGNPQKDIWTNVGLCRSGLLDSKTCVQTGHHARPANLSSFHIVSYFLHDLTSKVMPWQLLLLGMFPIIKAGCGPCSGNLDFSWVCSKPAHPHSFRSCNTLRMYLSLVKKKNMLFHTVYTLYIVT